MTQPLIVKIPIRDRSGRTIGEREVASYAGLLARAHEEGLDHIETTIIQLPTAANGEVAVVRAIVRARRGMFTGIGDASPQNCNAAVARHLIRMAETRAKARAFRDLVCIGTVALDELGGDEDVVDEPARPAPASKPAPSNGYGAPITDKQRMMLLRLAHRLGHQGDAANAFIVRRLGLSEDKKATKQEASRLIQDLEGELREHEGGSHAA